MRSSKYLILAGLFFGCSGGGFGPEQQATIEGEGPMRVFVVDNERDSLLLRRPSRRLTGGHMRSPWLPRLEERMLATVTDPSNSGVGIAAPQVGVLLDLIAVQRFDKQGEPFEFYINPRVTKKSRQMVSSKEGCLSVPGRSGEVLRREWIEISYLDPGTFEKRSERVEGFTAIIFQHETDHLRGRLYTDL
jgi:peptide deformylase